MSRYHNHARNAHMVDDKGKGIMLEDDEEPILLSDQDDEHETFVRGDIEKITKLKPVKDIDDFWAWKYNKNGLYSVKSGYWLACQVYNTELIREASALPSLNPLKEKVWKLETEPKIKTFLWKALSEALAVDDGLAARGMRTDGSCQLCGLEGESINHVLFTCTVARLSWAVSGLPIPQQGFDQCSIYQNFAFCLSLLKDERIESARQKLMSWLLWNIWNSRNSFLFEGIPPSPMETIGNNISDCELWMMAQSTYRAEELRDLEISKGDREKWEPPMESEVKCTIGVAWSKKKKLCGSSWVVRDKDGVVLLHSMFYFDKVDNINDTYWKTWKWAIQSMVSHRLPKVSFTLEAKNIVSAIKRPPAWPSFRFMSTDLRSDLLSVPSWSTVVEAPSSNRGAFLIAQSALHPRNRRSYVARDHPRWLNSLFASEKCSSSS